MKFCLLSVSMLTSQPTQQTIIAYIGRQAASVHSNPGSVKAVIRLQANRSGRENFDDVRVVSLLAVEEISSICVV